MSRRIVQGSSTVSVEDLWNLETGNSGLQRVVWKEGRKQEGAGRGIHSSRGTRHTSPCNGIPLVLFSAHPDPSLKPPRWARRYAERGRA